MSTHTGGRSSAPGDRGAAAVEFALIMPILFTLVIGIVQYGLYFYDAHGTRAGVREAARQAVVQGSFAGCSGAYLDKVRCGTKAQVDAITGPIAVKVTAPTWQRGKPVTVCAEVQSQIIGFVPMPRDGLIRTKTQMSIEVDAPVPASLVSQDAPLSGDWSWC